MRKRIIVLLIFLFQIVIILAENITLEYNFDKPEIKRDTKTGYDYLEYSEGFYRSQPGAPDLPRLAERIILKPGEAIVSVEVVNAQYKTLEGKYKIKPSQQQYPISYVGETEITEPDSKIYKDDRFYPENLIDNYSTGYRRGIGIGSIVIAPYRYNPVTGEISYPEYAEIVIKTSVNHESSRAYNNNYRGKINDKTYLEKNTEHADNLFYYHEVTQRTLDYDYVIITGSNYTADFNDFITMKTYQGYNVLTKTVEDIYNEYTGVDNAEQIRNFILDVYQNNGAEYILLGGDVEIIPHRGFYLAAGSTIDEDLPSDLYFGGLDRVGTGSGPDWNCDNDSYWGEPAEADYYADVFVGRISADSHTEFAAALNKQIMYQSQPVVSDIENAIMVGEELNDDPYTYGGTYKDEIVDGGTYNTYYTEGFPDNFNFTYHYDRDGDWGWSDLKDSFNAGTHLVNHLGHSNTNYNMKFSTSYVTDINLTSSGIDSGFYIIYSQGCYPAAFDNRNSYGNYGDDCIVEAFTTIDNGCVAFLGNTRYGWYNPGGTNSSSQFLDRHFFDAMFGESIFGISAAHEDSRFDGASQCSGDPWFRWSFYEVTVFGDPSLDIWTEQPQNFDVDHVASLPLGATELIVNTSTVSARIAVVQDGELIGRAITAANGNATVIFDSSLDQLEPLDIFVNGHNMNQYQGQVLVISNQPYVIHQGYTIEDDDGNGNNEADYGESVSLDLTFGNVGNQNAYGVTASLSCDDSYVTITDGSENIGTINAESTLTITDCFAFDVADNIPDQHQLDFEVTTTGSNRDTWTSYFSIIVNAPNLVAVSGTINDVSGNNNQRLDPGESVDLSIEISNDGHLSSPSGNAQISSTSSYLTIQTGTDILNSITAGNNSEVVFSLDVDPYTPLGTNVEIVLSLNYGSYIFNKAYYFTVGMIIEDFESDDFSQYPWEMSGSSNWITTGSSPSEGVYCAKSGTITHNQSSELLITAEVLAAGDITFYRKVSSENNYDYLRFYIDDIQQSEWSGTVSWSQVSYAVSTGEHTFKWSYEKDYSVNSGSDCCWIDYIVFPSISIPSPATIILDNDSFEFQLFEDENSNAPLIISNIGDSPLTYTISSDYSSREGDITIGSDTNNRTDNWLSISPVSGSVNSGSNQQIILTADATDINAGEYHCDLTINSNDPIQSSVIIPVDMTVNLSFLESPQNIRILILGNQVQLSWDSVPGATGYKIYGSERADGEYIQIGTSPNTHWVDSVNSKRFYKVKAYN